MLTESTHTAEFLLSEGPGQLSREAVTVLSGQKLAAGAVCGRVSKGVGRVSVPTVVTEGSSNGTVSAVYAGPDVEVGSYVLTCTAAATHGGVFSLVTPSGKALPPLTMTAGAGVATNYRSSHLNFTITDGSGDFEVGDTFTFVVSTTAPGVVGTGNGTISAITLGPLAQPGNYKIVATATDTNAGTFEVIAPDGRVVGLAATVSGGSGGTATIASDHLNATITDGSTDFAVGDYFNVAVFNQLGGGKVTAFNPAGVDGSQDPAGILYGAVDASTADASGVLVVRAAEVAEDLLAWGAAVSVGQQAAALGRLARERGIVAR